MARKERVHQFRRKVLDVITAAGNAGITKNDVITRLSGQVGIHQIQESIDYLQIKGLILRAGSRCIVRT